MTPLTLFRTFPKSIRVNHIRLSKSDFLFFRKNWDVIWTSEEGFSLDTAKRRSLFIAYIDGPHPQMKNEFSNESLFIPFHCARERCNHVQKRNLLLRNYVFVMWSSSNENTIQSFCLGERESKRFIIRRKVEYAIFVVEITYV